MSRTIDLTETTSLAAGDQIRIASTAQGSDRRASLTTLVDFVSDNLTAAGGTFASQYSAPLTGVTVTVGSTADDADGSENVHLIITPAGTIAALTIKLPLSTDLVDKQEVLINCTQTVTTLSWDANGASDIVGEPTTFAANGFCRLKYDALLSKWYRVG